MLKTPHLIKKPIYPFSDKKDIEDIEIKDLEPLIGQRGGKKDPRDSGILRD